jgi:AMP-binding enzyme
VILGDPTGGAVVAAQGQRRASIDEVFHRIAQRQPDAPALIDAPNRAAFTDGSPRRLTYAEADRAVTAIAGRLRRMGLTTDAIVGIQLPNIAESILTILGVMRAGMIAAPLPLLWRRADAVTALGRIGAKALITCGHVGSFNHCHLAMRIASEVFSIRFVCAYGNGLPDGVVAFDDLFTAERPDPLPPLERERLSNAAAHIGLITFDVGENGLVPVARNHLQIIAGGLGVTLESHLTQGERILSTMPASSFAGIGLTLIPWLLTAGTLCLHHQFDPDVLAKQRRDEACRTLILPGSVALRLAEAAALTGGGTGTLIAAWRAPERLASSPAWGEPETSFVDVQIFGEAGLIAAQRSLTGRPAAIPFGPVVAPRGSSGGLVVAELTGTPESTVGLRGPMVPRHAFPPGIERSGLPHFVIGRSGLVDTGYTCRIDSLTKAMVVTGPPSGMIGIGGYRFSLRQLQEAIGKIDSDATLAALPDPVTGQRLIGNAANRELLQGALNAVGINPLVAAAFRDRSMRAPMAAFLGEP